MRTDNLPKAALDWSQVGVMDTLGCTLAGVAEEAPAKVAELIGVNLSGGESLVLGTAGRASALDAALMDMWDMGSDTILFARYSTDNRVCPNI
jgi:2-methylcitrate dehydratase PrpD